MLGISKMKKKHTKTRNFILSEQFPDPIIKS